MTTPTDTPPEAAALDLERLAEASDRIGYLFPLEVDSFDELVGPICEDGFGRYSPDMEGQDGEDITDLLNAIPALIAEVRAARQQAKPQGEPEPVAREGDSEAWRKPPPHFKADPQYQRQPQSDEEWDRHADPIGGDAFRAKRRLAFAGDLADPRAPPGMALVSRWDITTVLSRLTWLEARFENTKDTTLAARSAKPVATSPSAGPFKDPEMNRLLAGANARFAALSPEEQQAQMRAQRESWVRSEMAWGDEGTRLLTTPAAGEQGGEG